jgi:hypothetical protein
MKLIYNIKLIVKVNVNNHTEIFFVYYDKIILIKLLTSYILPKNNKFHSIIY